MKKRCKECRKLLSGENFNAHRRSEDGLASTCRACVNQRRRQLDHERRRLRKPSPSNVFEDARRGRLNVMEPLAPGDLQVLLWKSIQDIHTIRKGPEHIALARLLIQKGARPHWWMICEAARSGNQGLVEMLAGSGIEMNIFVAAALGEDTILSEFLEKDGSPGRANESHEGHDNIATFNRVTPLHCCAMSALGTSSKQRKSSLLRCAERLIEAGANVNARADIRGLQQLTPLHCACWTGGNTQVAGLLLETDADPKGCLKFALGHFQRHGKGHYKIAELLVATGIDLHDELDEMLQLAANQGDAQAVSWLLAHGANPNVKSKEGKTPLHFAAERNPGNKVIKLLIAQGADLNARTSDGHTAFYLARLNKKRVAADYLRLAGGV